MPDDGSGMERPATVDEMVKLVEELTRIHWVMTMITFPVFFYIEPLSFVHFMLLLDACCIFTLKRCLFTYFIRRSLKSLKVFFAAYAPTCFYQFENILWVDVETLQCSSLYVQLYIKALYLLWNKIVKWKQRHW